MRVDDADASRGCGGRASGAVEASLRRPPRAVVRVAPGGLSLWNSHLCQGPRAGPSYTFPAAWTLIRSRSGEMRPSGGAVDVAEPTIVHQDGKGDRVRLFVGASDLYRHPGRDGNGAAVPVPSVSRPRGRKHRSASATTSVSLARRGSVEVLNVANERARRGRNDGHGGPPKSRRRRSAHGDRFSAPVRSVRDRSALPHGGNLEAHFRSVSLVWICYRQGRQRCWAENRTISYRKESIATDHPHNLYSYSDKQIDTRRLETETTGDARARHPAPYDARTSENAAGGPLPRYRYHRRRLPTGV